MTKKLLLGLLLGLVLLVTACSSAPAPTSTPVIPPAPTTVALGGPPAPGNPRATIPAAPTAAPTATAIPPTTAATATPTVPPTQPNTPTTAPTPTTGAGSPTRAPATPAPSTNTPTQAPPTLAPIVPTATPPPSPTVVAGMFVTSLRIAPDPPLRGQNLSFFATIQNDTQQDIRWVVYIYRADTPNKPTGQTAIGANTIPIGAAEQQALGTWKLQLGGPCDYFFARVAWINFENKPIWFTTPDGKVFEKGFTICPP
ncbi:MAG: hypothetical protein WCF84_23535 [Anaerolineae bacterium]